MKYPPLMTAEQWMASAADMLRRVHDCVYACSHPDTAQELTELLRRRPRLEPVIVEPAKVLWP